jgi:hypothetical protein
VSQTVYLRAQPGSDEGELHQGGTRTAAAAVDTVDGGSSAGRRIGRQAVDGASDLSAAGDQAQELPAHSSSGTCKHTKLAPQTVTPALANVVRLCQI